VNTFPITVARVGAGLFSTVLAAVLLLMVGGLLVADHALRGASEEQAQIDATESAHVVEQVIARQVDGLSSMHGLLLGSQSRRPEEFTALARSFARGRSALRHVWIADSTGRVLYDTLIIASAPASIAARRHGQELGIAEAIRTREPRVTLTGDGSAREALVFHPFVVGERLIGVAAAAFAADTLFAVLSQDAPQTRAALVLRASSDTILNLSLASAPKTMPRRPAQARVPGATWQLEVGHTETSQRLRITLWVLGFVAVTFLGGGVLRERRQALRVAERSAELERLSSELLRANRMKSEFLANVSHELRTPLNAIVGFVDLLRDGVYGDLSARQAPPVERIAASATHLRHLVDQVLDIAKIAAGRLEVHAETIVLRPFVLNVASELEPLISERGLNLSLAVGASLPRVRTDPTQLRQILVNLIGNAIKYTPTGGIAVRARLAGMPTPEGRRRNSPEDPTLLSRSPDRRRVWIALQVVDTGIGIAPSDLERIFDEFEQVNAGPRGDSMERGTGLGLAISRRLARLLGGELSVESQPGKGSTFTIWLPVSPADLHADPSLPTSAERPVIA
jgi:signal transduction histidine kinase